MSLLIDERKESLQKLLDAKREMRRIRSPSQLVAFGAQCGTRLLLRS